MQSNNVAAGAAGAATGELAARAIGMLYPGVKLSDLSESQALYMIEAMKVVHLVGQASSTDLDDLQAAETGEYIRGDGEAIKALESGDAGKMEQANRAIDETFRRLATAFMYSANTRDGERVTAYELQQQAMEVENTMGGAYSTLSSCVQTPLAHILIAEVRGSVLPAITSGDLKLDIEAGIPALGRATAVQNLMTATQEIGVIMPVTQLDKRISPQRVVDMCFAGHSVDSGDLFFTEDEQKANAEAATAQAEGMQQLQAAQAAAGELQQMEAQ